MTTYTKTNIGFSTDIHNGSLTNTRTATGIDIYNKTHTVPCIDTKTNSRTATQTNSPTETDTNTSDTNRRIYRKKNQFYKFFFFFVSILSLVRTLFLILRDLKIMNVILVFTIVP